MKAPLIFKGDARFVYASGVVRGLENFLLTRADYQKVMDAEVHQLGTVLGEIGYGGGEHDPEHALDLATEQLLALMDKLGRGSEIPQILRRGFDFRNAAAYLKWRWFGTKDEKFDAYLGWGEFEPAALVEEIEKALAGEKHALPPYLARGVEQSRELVDKYSSPIAVDVALDGAYFDYLRAALPKGEYFARYLALLADWQNLRGFVRGVNLKLNQRLVREGFLPGGDIPQDRLDEAFELEREAIPGAFAHTEYGSGLNDVLKEALSGNLGALDVFFRAKLIDLYRYTRYCLFGPELLWAYAQTKLEEINTLRTILRAKAARLPMDLIKEVISVVLE